MTSSRRHSRAPLRRSSAPEKIISAGLATATCVGMVGLIGARTISANAAASATDTAASAAPTASIVPVVVTDTAAVPPTGVAEPVTTSDGLTQADLDAYAAALSAERDRLDAYRTKLVKAAKKLQLQVDAQAARGSGSSVSQSSPGTTSAKPASRPAARPAAKPASKPASKPAAKPASKPKVTKPKATAPAAPAAPAQPAAPKPAPAPQQQNPPQSNTKTS